MNCYKTNRITMVGNNLKLYLLLAGFCLFIYGTEAWGCKPGPKGPPGRPGPAGKKGPPGKCEKPPPKYEPTTPPPKYEHRKRSAPEAFSDAVAILGRPEMPALADRRAPPAIQQSVLLRLKAMKVAKDPDVMSTEADISTEVMNTGADISTEVMNTEGDISTEVMNTEGDISTEVMNTEGDISTEVMNTEGDISTEVMNTEGAAREKSTSIISVLCAVTKMKLDLPGLRGQKDLQARKDRRGLANANIK
uniref:Uncharacterized protein n=1 Tax=Globodera rostochiensis TaxID=31243 RepID=A0A914H6M8_GLORO